MIKVPGIPQLKKNVALNRANCFPLSSGGINLDAKEYDAARIITSEAPEKKLLTKIKGRFSASTNPDR